MGAELREAFEKHLFNYTWGDPDGGGCKIFTSTDIRLGASGDDDFTLRASNLKEALAKIKKGNFAVCRVQAPFVPSGEDPGKKDSKLFTASGCPVTFPHATRGLVKVEQRGGTGGEEDWATYHAKTPWQIVFQHENQSVTWDLVKTAKPSRRGNVRDGVNMAEPCLSGKMKCGTATYSPKQHLMKDPLKGGRKEKDRIRRATKSSKVYLVGDPHWRRKKEEEKRKEHDDSGVETEASVEVSQTPKKVIRHWPFSYSLATIYVYIVQQLFTYYLSPPINFVIFTHPKLLSYDQLCQAVSVPHAMQRDQRPTTQASLLAAAGKVKRPSRLKMFLEKKRQAKLARIPKTLDTSAQVEGIP